LKSISIESEERISELTAYVTVLADEARARVRVLEEALYSGEDVGPLAGVPVAIKDLYGAKKGVRETFGSKPLANFRAEENATFVERIEDAGGIVLEKTDISEFGHKRTTGNKIFSPTSMHFETGRNAGGSSGGVAAAVAVGLAPLGQGSDGGGSVRISASFCGVYGFNCSHRRPPSRERPDAFACIAPYTRYGPLARTVTDAALMLDVITGPHPNDPLVLPDDGAAYSGAAEKPIDDFSIVYGPMSDRFPVDKRVADVVDEVIDAFVSRGADVVGESSDILYSHHDLCGVWMTMHEQLLANINESFK